MTLEQFWHGDPNLITIYQKAYNQKIHDEAFLQGWYNFEALSRALTNALSGLDGKRHKPIQYLDKPLVNANDYYNKPVTEEELEDKYRAVANYQVDWLNKLSNNK